MKKYSCVMFDLDGTLANTFSGILNSYRYACQKMELNSPTETVVGEAIGAPLLEVFERRFCLEHETALLAVMHYREYYATNGIYEVKTYDKMEEVLKELKMRGYMLAVATLKKESFAVEILRTLGLYQYFDIVVGMNDGDSLTKSQMLDKVINTLSCDKSTSLLVGDSSYDAIGADESKIDFIGVTYGFGFTNKEEISNYKNVGVIDNPIELIKIL